jgi:hypothetical protein
VEKSFPAGNLRFPFRNQPDAPHDRTTPTDSGLSHPPATGDPMLTTALGRLLGPAHRTIALTSGALILLVVAVNLPALLVLSATRTGAERSQTLINLITDWASTLSTSPPGRSRRRSRQGSTRQ